MIIISQVAAELASYRILIYIDMNTYILTEGKNFNVFLHERFAIAFHSCYLFTEENLNIDSDMILIVPREFSYIRNSWTLQPIWCIHFSLSRWRVL